MSLERIGDEVPDKLVGFNAFGGMITAGARGRNYQVKAKANDFSMDVLFQLGCADTIGVNGLINEDLIMILIDRLSKLNNEFQCEENDIAIHHLKVALNALEARSVRITRFDDLKRKGLI